MFKKLKDKLKNFFKEAEEVEEVAEQIEEEIKEPEAESKKAEEIAKEIKKPREYVEKSLEKPIILEKKTQEEETKDQILEKTIEKVKEREEKEDGLFKGMKKKFNLVKIKEKELDTIIEKLEILFLENNVALKVVDKLKTKLREELQEKEIDKREFSDKVKRIIKQTLKEVLVEPFDLIEKIKNHKNQNPEKPFVILFLGINGSGKTTAIAKIANLLKKNNMSCVFAASDTFRAASIEQLEKHANNLKIKIIKHDYNSDPAAVAFDAIKYAKSHKIDTVLIDTAGRMHTKGNLLREMEKIIRVTKPDLKIFIGESITGNDATEQAKSFNETADIDAIILSKADVDEKGGTALSVGYVTKKPIIYLGTGQEYKDLEPFNKEKLFEKLGL